MTCGDASLVRIDDPELAKVVERARMELLLTQPSLAAAVMRVPVVQVPSDTLPGGIGIGSDAIVVSQALRLVQPSRVAYAYAHNLVHCLFEHVERRLERDPRVWNLVIDIAAASLIHPLLDPSTRAECAESDARPAQSEWFAALVRAHESHSCEQIYDALAKLGSDQLPIRSARGASPSRGTRGDRETGPGFEGESDRSGHAYELDLGLPAQVSCSPEDRQVMMQEIAEAMRAEGLPGTAPGRWQELAKRARTRPVPWERLFAEQLEGLVPTDYQTYPFSKRHLWRGVYLPSLARRGVGRVLFAIDTSGSMTLPILGQIVDQIDQLRQATMCSLTIAHFDTTIQSTADFDEYSDPIERDSLRVHGRGGTDIRAPFTYLDTRLRRGEQFAGIVVATDGCGPLPGRPPARGDSAAPMPIPTIWLVPDWCADEFRPPFGRVIRCGAGRTTGGPHAA